MSQFDTLLFHVLKTDIRGEQIGLWFKGDENLLTKTCLGHLYTVLENLVLKGIVTMLNMLSLSLFQGREKQLAIWMIRDKSFQQKHSNTP